jgi:hypothetical protein
MFFENSPEIYHPYAFETTDAYVFNSSANLYASTFEGFSNDPSYS